MEKIKGTESIENTESAEKTESTEKAESMKGTENTESILTSVKKLLGIDEGYTHFDPDLIMHINSVFSILAQMGVGPPQGYSISGAEDSWSKFIIDQNCLPLVKSYVYLKVRLLFDQPVSAAAIDSIHQQIKEFEWRLFVAADTPVNSS